MKWRIPSSLHWHLFYYFGLDGILGTSYKWDDGTAFSAGFGMRSVSRDTVDATTNHQTVSLIWNVGFFYEKNNSLLASLFFNGTFNDAVTQNFYPGAVSIRNISPGFWMTVGRDGSSRFGITTRWVPGIAL